MTITNCPRCGSMNITTAGVCANCGWSQFAQVTTVSTRITGEINLLEEMDLLYAKIHRLKDICEQANIMLNQRDEIEEGLNKRIAELEGFINQLIEAGESEDSPMPAVWLELVYDWKEREE